MAVLEYLDFDLLIERAGKSRYRVRVLSSPAGQASGTIQLPFSDLELENFLLRIGRPRRGVRRIESPEMEAAKEFGGKLFKAIFEDELMSALRSSLDDADKQERGLRIRLRLNDVPELVNLPWEYLYNPALNRFLTLSVTTPVVRYLELPERITPLAVRPPLRVLVMIASPSDFPGLDVEHEWHNLNTSLGGLVQRGLLKLDRLDKATPLELQSQLRREKYNIFHFIGHGGFHEQAQDGILVLADENGRGQPLSGQFLGTLLHDERSLRLVVLNACEGARSGRTDPFAGVAQSMVQQGIPAVIAMQFEISDTAAIAFGREFYTAVAEGYPVDAAVAEARKAIYALGNDIEWGTPVLYMRAPDGLVFELGTPEAAPPPEGLPMQAGGESVQDLPASTPTEERVQIAAVEFEEPQQNLDQARLVDSARHQHLGALQQAVVNIFARDKRQAMIPLWAVALGLVFICACLAFSASWLPIGPGGRPLLAWVLPEYTNTPAAIHTLAATHTLTESTPTKPKTVTATLAPAATWSAIPALPATFTPFPLNGTNGKIAFLSERNNNWDIWVMDPDGMNLNRLTRGQEKDILPEWSPDGREIAFVSERDENKEIYVIDVASSKVRRLTNHPAEDTTPGWSPDGSRIAFTTDRDGNQEIYTMNSDGSNLVNITNHPANDGAPAWSPDGQKIAFRSNRDGNQEIYVMNASGTQVTRLTNHADYDDHPAWSPDGLKIAYDTERDGNLEIYSINVDGSGLARLTFDAADDSLPDWSPDGKIIIFYSERSGNCEIYIMNTDGSGLRNLTNNAADDRQPDWQRLP